MFDGDNRYTRNDLKEWLDKYGEKVKDASSARSNCSAPASPRSPKTREKKGEEKGEEGEVQKQRYPAHTGTA